VMVDEYNESQNYPSCTSTTKFKGFVWALVAVNGLLLVYGAYLGYAVRKIPMKRFAFYIKVLF